MSQGKPDLWGVVQDPNFGKAPFAVKVSKANQLLRTIRLEKDVTYIGRMPENHVVLDDPKVSRSHARIIGQGNSFLIEDQQSENGMYVDGKKVAKLPLTLGTKVMIGDHLLEFIEAPPDVKSAIRESQLDQAEEEEWRMDQTVSVTSEQLQKVHLQKMKAKEKKQAAKLPEIHCSVVIGDKKVEKTITFDKPTKKPASDSKANELDVRLTLGDWVFEKKITL